MDSDSKLINLLGFPRIIFVLLFLDKEEKGLRRPISFNQNFIKQLNKYKMTKLMK